MSVNQMVEEFLRHRRATEQFCALMPDPHFDYAFREGSLTFGAQAMHLAGAADWFLSFVDGVQPARPDPVPQTPAAIRDHLARNTRTVVARMEAIDDLERVVSFWNQGPAPVWAVLGRLREHEAHHKGQMMQMLRNCGVTEKLFYIVP